MKNLLSLLLLTASLLWSCQEVVSPPQIDLPEGFVVEHLYNPTAHEQGSWVAMTTDDQGRLITSDQYGNLYRVTVPEIGQGTEVQVETIPLEIGRANGLLYAFNSLYVVVNNHNEEVGYTSGLFRLTDTNGDDQYDQKEQLRSFEGAGEHGPHAILLAPDGESLYILAGNHTDLPEMDHYQLPKTWGEDRLYESLKDTRGHAYDRKAPGGWVAQIDPEGKEWTLVSAGYRNPYDMAFNDAGDLFVFDADMEWDMGMPWYRPIRLCHATKGGEFGWRTGSGKWADYYPDNLPAVVNIGQGSPTGVIYGKDLKFPARYQQGMFLFDWSFGTMYFIDLEPDGSTYTGTKEEFLSGTPLPLTDGVVGADGAMYFATGGRRLQSDLYRVYYTGTEATEPAGTTEFTEAQNALRKQRLQWEEVIAQTGAAPLPELNDFRVGFASEDRFVRYAARLALEQYPVSDWVEWLPGERDPMVRLQMILALARSGDDSHKAMLWEALSRYRMSAWPAAIQADIVRAMALTFSRYGAPAANYQNRFLAELEPIYPSQSPGLDRELCELLVYLGSEEVVNKTLTMMLDENTASVSTPIIEGDILNRSKQYGPTIAKMLEKLPPSQEIAYVQSLSHARAGWTYELRRQYFSWFYEALQAGGGMSYRGFLDQMRVLALDHTPEEEKEALADIAGTLPKLAGADLANLPQPQGPGKNWHTSEVGKLRKNHKGETRNFANGQKMYQATYCAACHSIAGEGGNAGPDLTQVGTRFRYGDIALAIIAPSDHVSDQYAATMLELKDGKKVVGRIVSENESEIQLNPSPLAPDQLVTVAKADIAEQSLSPVSPMPAGLINRLNDQEVLDLMAYLVAGGNPEHEVYQ
jgi:putative heme-binding domain-containing protein